MSWNVPEEGTPFVQESEAELPGRCLTSARQRPGAQQPSMRQPASRPGGRGALPQQAQPQPQQTPWFAPPPGQQQSSPREARPQTPINVRGSRASPSTAVGAAPPVQPVPPAPALVQGQQGHSHTFAPGQAGAAAPSSAAVAATPQKLRTHSCTPLPRQKPASVFVPGRSGEHPGRHQSPPPPLPAPQHQHHVGPPQGPAAQHPQMVLQPQGSARAPVVGASTSSLLRGPPAGMAPQPHLQHAPLFAQANRGCFSARELAAPETAALGGSTSARSFVPMVTPRLPRAGRFSQPARIVRSVSPTEREHLSSSCVAPREVEVAVKRAQIGTRLFEDVLPHFQPQPRLSDPTFHAEQRRPAEVLRHSVQVPPCRSEAWTAVGRKSVSPNRTGVGYGFPGMSCQDTVADDFAEPQTQPPPPTQQPQPPLQQHQQQHQWPPQISRQLLEEPGQQQQQLQYQHSWALSSLPTGSATVDATLKALENCRTGGRGTLRDSVKYGGGGGSLQLGKAGSIAEPQRPVQHRCLYPSAGDDAEEEVVVGQVRRRYSPRGGLSQPGSPGSLLHQQSRPLAPCRQRTSAGVALAAGVLAQAEEAQELLRRVQCASSASASACAAAGLSARGTEEDTFRRPMFSGGSTSSSQQPSARGPTPPGPPSPPKRQCRSLDRLLEMADLQPRGWDSPPVDNSVGTAPARARRPRSPVAMSPASQALQQQLEHRELQQLLQKQQQVLQQQQLVQQQEQQKLLMLQQQHQRLVQQQKQQLLEKKARQQEEKDRQLEEQQQKAAAPPRRPPPCKPLQDVHVESKEQQLEENRIKEEESAVSPEQQPQQKKPLTPEKGTLLGEKENHAAEDSVLSPSASTESPQPSDMDSEDQLLSPTTPGQFEVDESAVIYHLPFEPILDLLQAEDFQRCRDERVVHIQVPEGVGADLKVRVQLKNMVLELEVPENSEVGSIVACDPPTQPPMSGPVQRDLLVGGVLHQRLRWFQLADGNITCDDGPGGRYRCKLDALRAMRGRCMGAVLPRLLEEGDEDTMSSEMIET